MHPFIVFLHLNIGIQDAKYYEAALNEHCNLTYFDIPITIYMLHAHKERQDHISKL